MSSATAAVNAEGWKLLMEQLGDCERSQGAEYERLHERLRLFFRWKGAAEPGELADRVLDRVVRKLSEGTRVQTDIQRFTLGIARFVLKEAQAEAQRKRSALRREISGPSPTEILEHEQQIAALELCLGQLPNEDARLIREYYVLQGRTHIARRRSIAERLSISVNALRLRASRIRSQLERCVAERLNPPAEGATP